MFARQPCYHLQTCPDLGQWLCVPPFRVVCPYRERTFVITPIRFSNRYTRMGLPRKYRADMRYCKICLHRQVAESMKSFCLVWKALPDPFSLYPAKLMDETQN